MEWNPTTFGEQPYPADWPLKANHERQEWLLSRPYMSENDALDYFPSGFLESLGEWVQECTFGRWIRNGSPDHIESLRREVYRARGAMMAGRVAIDGLTAMVRAEQEKFQKAQQALAAALEGAKIP